MIDGTMLRRIIICVFVGFFVFNVPNTQAAVSDGFDYPVGPPYVTQASDGDGYYNAQDFGYYNSTFGKYHLGEDWNGEGGGNTDEGDPVYAVSNGAVVYAGFYSSSWGNIITIHHSLPSGEYGGVVESMYAHIQTILVSNGQTVTRGQQIGTIGRTGTSAGSYAHLHFEIRSDETIGASTGYSSTPMPTGWLDPSDFLDSHRTFSTCYGPMVPLTVDAPAISDDICSGFYQQYSFPITSGRQYKVTITPSSRPRNSRFG